MGVVFNMWGTVYTITMPPYVCTSFREFMDVFYDLLREMWNAAGADMEQCWYDYKHDRKTWCAEVLSYIEEQEEAEELKDEYDEAIDYLRST